jgi:hypothetical protein
MMMMMMTKKYKKYLYEDTDCTLAKKVPTYNPR